MNVEDAQALGVALCAHGLASVPFAEVPALVAENRMAVGDFVPFGTLWLGLMHRRTVCYDFQEVDDYGHALVPLEQIVGEHLTRISEATGGEWVPAASAIGYDASGEGAFAEFEFAGERIRLCLELGSGDILDEVNKAFDGFAAQRLAGRLVEVDGMGIDVIQCCYLPVPVSGSGSTPPARLTLEGWLSLPMAATAELRPLRERATWAWPSADELTAMFRTVTVQPPDPGTLYQWELRDDLHTVWAATMELLTRESALLHVNIPDSRGDRPLHVLVTRTRELTEEVLRQERLELIHQLVVGFGADPHTRDAAGRTAFDCAAGDQGLAVALSKRTCQAP
ncbi:MAG: hypothetical protein ACRDNZ_13120 [Streptosporangiaceae bacterium]